MDVKWKDGIMISYDNWIIISKYTATNLFKTNNIELKDLEFILKYYNLRNVTELYQFLPQEVKDEFERIGKINFKYFDTIDLMFKCFAVISDSFYNDNSYCLKEDYKDSKLKVGTKLFTKDGRKYSNCNVLSVESDVIVVVNENNMWFCFNNEKEIEENFYIGES